MLTAKPARTFSLLVLAPLTALSVALLAGSATTLATDDSGPWEAPNSGPWE